MKELRNKSGDLAMVIDAHYLYDGMVVECIEYYGSCSLGWKTYTKKASILYFQDKQLIPLGGEHVLTDEPEPELTQSAEAELEKEELCL